MENNRKIKQNILIIAEVFSRLKSDRLNYKGNNDHISFNKNLQLDKKHADLENINTRND